MTTRLVHTREELRGAMANRSGEVGVVMTMGALHDGHRELIKVARRRCKVIVVTVFLNPLQFAPSEDLSRYPMTLDADVALCAEEDVDLVFAPSVEEVYPAGEPQVRVHAGPLGDVLEGASRPGHFDGVLTVVAKLLHLTSPDVAYFGQKDAQQLAVVRRMVRDLDLPVRIAAQPTVREPDGLAMSSRNRYLAGADRERATALSRALATAREAAEDGERDARAIAAKAKAAMVEHGVEPEYLELVSTDTLAPVEEVGDAEVLVAVAARVGPARLIDNTVIHANGRH
jgi:pantoate--beta-alanine ligase